jgi:hypothetical protein
MAARRLIAILIALLIASSIAAALAPEREDSTSDDPPPPAERERTPPRADADAGILRERVPADPKRPRTISAAVGDQLTLLVEAASPTAVTIPGLGRSAFATALTPARFVILPRQPGRHAVMVGDETVAHIEVD